MDRFYKEIVHSSWKIGAEGLKRELDCFVPKASWSSGQELAYFQFQYKRVRLDVLPLPLISSSGARRVQGKIVSSNPFF
jgi:hypothetical protein